MLDNPSARVYSITVMKETKTIETSQEGAMTNSMIQADQAAFYGDDAIHCIEAGNADNAYSQARRAARFAADSITSAEMEAHTSETLEEDIDSAGDFISEHHMEMDSEPEWGCHQCAGANHHIELAQRVLASRAPTGFEASADYRLFSDDGRERSR